MPAGRISFLWLPLGAHERRCPCGRGLCAVPGACPSCAALSVLGAGVHGRKRLTYREYAAFAHQTAAEVARDCEVGVFRATGPGGRALIPPIRPCACVMFQRDCCYPRESRSQFQNRASCVRNSRRSFLVAPCRPRCATHQGPGPPSAVAALRTNACAPTSRPRAAASPATNNVTKSPQVYFVTSWRGLSTVRAPGRNADGCLVRADLLAIGLDGVVVTLKIKYQTLPRRRWMSLDFTCPPFFARRNKVAALRRGG